MATDYRGPQFGLLPNKRISWQTLATSYGIELAFILLLVNIGLLFPEKLKVKTSYHLAVGDAIDRPRTEADAEAEAADHARQVVAGGACGQSAPGGSAGSARCAAQARA